MKSIDNFFSNFNNFAIVKKYYGKWPNLHDLEIIEIAINRELGFDFTGPNLRLTLYISNISNVTDSLNNSSRNKSRLILVFSSVELNFIKEFNHQNAMKDFLLEQYYCNRLDQNRYHNSFGRFEAKVEFTCKTVEVESVKSFVPIDYFANNEVI